MLNIHVHTQYKENYGDEAQPYWKYKGGSTVIITGFTHPLTSGIGAAAEAVVRSVAAQIEYANAYAEEYIIDWSLEPVGALTEDERLQLEYDGRITYAAKRINCQS